jgi:esterase/lipase superfamily enzyme
MTLIRKARRGLRCGRAAAAALLLLSGCASTPEEGLLQPTGVVTPGASLVDMLVMTTRSPSPRPGVVFGGERDSGYSVAEIVVSIPPAQNRRIGQIRYPDVDAPDPQREFTTVSVKPSDSANTQAWFDRVAGPQGRLLIFVHGYNTRFDGAVYRLAQIAKDSGAEAAPALFTWPSKGSLFGYEYDRDSANFSRDALESLLTRAARSDKVKDITVLAHSMGAYLAMEALRQTAIRQGRLPDKIRNVVLASPDLDPMVFIRQYEDFGPTPPHLTIFVTRDDRALKISRWISGKVRRLGNIDPAKEPYRSRLEANPGITVIDLSAYESGDSLNHAKFAESPEVVQLIGHRLVNGQHMTGKP